MAALMSVVEAIGDCLPDYLSIHQWVQLMHPDADNQIDRDDEVKSCLLRIKRKKESDDLIDACKAGLPYKGNIDGWTYGNTNPHPVIKKSIPNMLLIFKSLPRTKSSFFKNAKKGLLNA